MNDRFKFRAWYKPNYRKPIMLYDVEKTYDFMRGEPESICADCFGEVLEDEDYIVMQCTGLKDKNGKLIYEGDIVKETVVDYIDEEFLTVVCWSNLKASYNIDDTIHCEREVVGNIYENKELLDERN